MKKLTLLFVCLCSCLLLAHAKRNKSANLPSAKIEETEYDLQLKDFSDLEVTTAVKLEYTQSDEYSVKLYATPERAKRFLVEKRDDALVLSSVGDEQTPFRVVITAPKLENIKVSGVLTMVSAAPVKQSKMVIAASGVITLDLASLTVDKFSMDAPGVATFTLPDVTANTLFSLNISGVVNGRYTLKGKKCKIVSSGVSNIEGKVYCEELSLRNNGVGSVRLEGNADMVDSSGNGVCNIDLKKLNMF